MPPARSSKPRLVRRPTTPSTCGKGKVIKMVTLPFGLVLHPLGGEQQKAWYLRHLTTCPSCRRDAMHPDGHANSNTAWLHCIKEFYLPQLAQLANVEITVAARVLDGLSAIPLCAESIRHRAQEVRAGKE
jgi:hypothetical protein